MVMPQCDCYRHEACSCDGARCALCEYDPRHGTPNGYGNLRCRCEECRAAHADFCYDRRAVRMERPVPEHVHGTPNGYGNYGCRCQMCSDAWVMDTLERYELRQQGLTRCQLGLQAKPIRRR